MNKIIKYTLAVTVGLSTPCYAATYNALEENNNDISFEIEKFDPRVKNKAQKTIELIKQAETAFKSEQFKEAEKLLLKALGIVKGNLKAEAKIVSILGNVYARQQQAEKLLPLAQNLVRRFPDQNIALSTLAGAQLVNKQFSQAAKTLNKIISKEPSDTNHRLLLVNLMLQQGGREKEAEQMLNAILKIQANNPKALLLKTKIKIKQKKFSEAMVVIKLIEDYYPKEAIAPQLKAELNLAEKNYAAALKFYQQSYQINPNNKVLFVMVDLMKVLKKESAAFALLNKALKTEDNNLAVHFKLATIYQQQKNYAQAEKHFKYILSEQKDNIIVLNNLAWNYLQQGKPEALELAKKAFNKAPKSPAIADTYGLILLEQGDKKLALSILNAAAKATPTMLDIQYHLALAYSKNGEKAKAVEILQQLNKKTAYYSEKKAAAQLLTKLK